MAEQYTTSAKKVRKETLRINLLGKPEVWLDDTLLTNFSTAKTEALLYYLAASGQMHSRESLAGMLWSEMPEANARRNLTKSLSVLRRLLEPFLLIEAKRVGFAPDATLDLDVTEFETAVSNASPTSKATQLYRDDFLAGFFVKDALAFEAWQLTQREKLRQLAIEALEKMTAQAAAEGDYDTSIATCRRLLELDPWRESTHRQLMRLLSQNGQLAAALTQYENCRQLLADELGVDPTPETTTLYEQIQTARAGRPNNLPAATTAFVGRQDEVSQISQMLLKPDCRLVTLAGIGGIGKTRLALAVGHSLNQLPGLHFLNGITFVPLQSVETAAIATETMTTADAIATAVAQTLNLYLPGRRSPAAEVAEYFEPEAQLLILDNFEQLVDGANWLAELLQRCPQLKLLVTSREPLNLAAEWRIALTGLPLPDDTHSPEQFAAVQLFLQAARQARPDFALTPQNSPHVVQLCQLVMGLPLAIKLAASWLRIMPAEQLTAELKQNLDILSTKMRDVPERQRSMRAVFDSTWEMLQQEEQTVLMGLSIFRWGIHGRRPPKPLPPRRLPWPS